MRERVAQDGEAHLPSTATISRINRFLRYGANGYRLILDRLSAAARG